MEVYKDFTSWVFEANPIDWGSRKGRQTGGRQFWLMAVAWMDMMRCSMAVASWVRLRLCRA